MKVNGKDDIPYIIIVMENEKCSKPPTSVQTMSKTTKQISRFGSGWSWFQHFWHRGWIWGAAHATAPAAGWQGLHSRPPDLRHWRGATSHIVALLQGFLQKALEFRQSIHLAMAMGAWWGTKKPMDRWGDLPLADHGRPWHAMAISSGLNGKTLWNHDAIFGRRFIIVCLIKIVAIWGVYNPFWDTPNQNSCCSLYPNFIPEYYHYHHHHHPSIIYIILIIYIIYINYTCIAWL